MEYKLLIEFIPKTKFGSILKLFPGYYYRKNFYLIQGRPFDFSFRITNIGVSAFSGADISVIDIVSVASLNVHYPISGQFKVSSLNPNESQDIFIANTVTLLEGLSWIKCIISPLQSADSIRTFQRELSTGKIIDFEKNNWGQELFIVSKSQISSNRLNKLVALLALLTFWDATMGIKNTILSILYFIGTNLFVVSSWLMSIKS
jgi:hypothetical protein